MKTKRAFFLNPFSFVLYHLSFVLTLSSFIFYLSSCQRSTAPVYTPQKLQLTVVDVSCTEAWLQLKTEGTEKAENDWVLQVFRDDSLVVNKDWGAGDSLIYLAGLQPATAYAFSAKLLRDNKLLFSSPKVTATTMDTTSHDFTWQTFEFGGQGGSSSFYDVAIIDENDIWAVGEIYTADDKYNAAHWNGEKWELKKITYGGWFWTIPIVFALSHNDVWFSAFVKWNGSRFIEYPVPKVLIGYNLNKIWGTSDNDLYIVGNEGLIAHYDGKEWKREVSNTEINLLDIWGNIISNKIWACGYNYNKGESVLLEKRKDKWQKIYKVTPDDPRWNTRQADTICGVVTSLWSYNGRKLWASTTSGIYFSLMLNNDRKDVLSWAPSYLVGFPMRIRGDSENNIIEVGHFGTVAHWNGIRWKHYIELYNPEGMILRSVDVKDNIVVAVGDKIILGRK